MSYCIQTYVIPKWSNNSHDPCDGLRRRVKNQTIFDGISTIDIMQKALQLKNS